jgi:hypothetical protein
MEFGITMPKKWVRPCVVITKRKPEVSASSGNRLPANIQLDVLVQELTVICQGNSPGERQNHGARMPFWTARNVIDGPFAVINADDFGQSAYKMPPISSERIVTTLLP